jgi:hypothetical protein
VDTERPDHTEGPEGAGAAEGTGTAGPARRRSSVLIASVAAAVLVAGGGGAYLATSAGDGSGGTTASEAPGGDGTPPPLVLDGHVGGIAPGEPGPGGVSYRASGRLPDGPDSAPVHQSAGRVTEAEVTRLARALGLEGRPVAEAQAWRIGSARDGEGPILQVNRQAPGTWTFQRYAPGSDDCKSAVSCPDEPSGGGAVSEEAARKAALPVLEAAGQEGARVVVGADTGAGRTVDARPVVGGLPTHGWPTGVTVGAGGEVVAGSGQLKAPVKGHTYPVLGAARTLELLNAAQAPDGPVGIGGCASAVPLDEPSDLPCATRKAPAGKPAEVEGAVFGLASHFVEARQTLVPSWLFEVRAPGAKETFTVAHPAIDPRFLKSPEPAATPDERPSPRPGAQDPPVEGYTTEGRELTVSFTGGVCSDYEVTAEEGRGRVTVKVTETAWPDAVCIAIAEIHHRTVRLEEPLGDRKVVGPDGEGVPLEKPGARLPR